MDKRLANDIKALILKDFGKTFDELKGEMKEKAIRWSKTYKGDDGYLRSPQNGYKVFYNTNPNYKQGRRNGGGLGWFAVLQGVGAVRTVPVEFD